MKLTDLPMRTIYLLGPEPELPETTRKQRRMDNRERDNAAARKRYQKKCDRPEKRA